MSLETKQAQLASVRSAITTIEGGAQAITVLGRNYTRATLKDLYVRERELERDIERLERGGSRMRLGVPTSK
ncbi:MAG: hypothetical protein KF709_02665 [Gemmatimonadaceae bacterium]|nr:hypothetical protein [Gemmatimonadaceae bacterium]